jgi:tetratricopeptide (TPR) repeat protein
MRWARVLAPGAFLDTLAEEQLTVSEGIVQEMNLLPLALDQAGAYIEETGCGLSAYLELYRTHRRELLHHRGYVPTNHPESVATTLSLSFQKVEQTNPAAADLLRVCAFLHPDAIPEELLLDLTVSDLYQFDLALAILRNTSLVTRHSASRTLSVHQLVQVVLRDQLTPAEIGLWSERVVRIVNASFPEPTIDTWAQCERLLAQVFACISLVLDEGSGLEELGSLVSRAGRYLLERGRYQEAKPLLTRAVILAEQQFPSHCSTLIARLLLQGEVSWRLGDIEVANAHWQRALALGEHTLETAHPQIADALVTVGLLCTEQGKYEQAEPLYRRALNIYEQLWGSEHEKHAETATILNVLALLYWEQGKYAQAEPLYWRALAIREQVLGPAHPLVGAPLNNLGLLYTDLGKYAQAEPLYRRALSLREQTWGPDHPSVAFSLLGFAILFTQQGQYKHAEMFAQRALYIREQILGVGHRDVAMALVCLAHVYAEQGHYNLAEPLFQRAHCIQNQVLGPDHPRRTFALNGLATIAGVQGKYEQAEALFQQAIRIEEQARGSTHVYVALGLHGLANVYRNQRKDQQAEFLYLRSLGIRERALVPQHLLIANTLHDLAVLKDMQGHDQEARPLYQRAMLIREAVLGREHPKTEQQLE